MKDCRGSVIWQSDQWMRGQIWIDCDRLVNGQPWSWLMTLNLNLIWSTHNNILSSRQGKRTKQIELALMIFFCSFLQPGHPGQFPDHIIMPQYNYTQRTQTQLWWLRGVRSLLRYLLSGQQHQACVGQRGSTRKCWVRHFIVPLRVTLLRHYWGPLCTRALWAGHQGAFSVMLQTGVIIVDCPAELWWQPNMKSK